MLVRSDKKPPPSKEDIAIACVATCIRHIVDVIAKEEHERPAHPQSWNKTATVEREPSEE